MANSSEHFLAHDALSMFQNSRKAAHAGDSIGPFLVSQLDSPHISSSCYSNPNECSRKRSIVDGSVKLQNNSSLALGLGCSTTSCVTMFSGRENDEESSVDLSLSISRHMRNDLSAEPRILSCGTAYPSRRERPKVDLELSLSAVASDSDVTSLAQGSILHQFSTEAPATASTLQLVDEGSTSSRWKRPLLPPLLVIETPSPFQYQVPTFGSPSPVITDLPVGSDSEKVPRRTNNVKTCQFNGCTRGARGASGFCIAHGGGRRCQRDGCHKGAEGRTVFCKAHGGGRRCEYLGCTKSAEGRTDYCIGHGGGKRCSHEGCIRAARGKSGRCIRHGGGKRCKMENCTKSAEGISGLCISHGGGRRCQYPACTKGAQGSTMFCKAHGGGKRCTFIGCTKGAEGSTSLCKAHGGGKRCTFEGGCSKSVHGGTLFCVNHGGGKRCAEPECTKSARGRTNFCVRHGGGKRCKHEGCGKSAQGSTDFCKAHGGGKRCSWGQFEFDGQATTPCDKFARGKSGLCASHSALVPEKKQRSDCTVNPTVQDSQPIGFMGSGHVATSLQIQPENALLGQFSLPEGRVHGGSLMAMLRGNTIPVPSPSEPGTSHRPPHSWL